MVTSDPLVFPGTSPSSLLEEKKKKLNAANACGKVT